MINKANYCSVKTLSLTTAVLQALEGLQKKACNPPFLLFSPCYVEH